MFSETTKSSPEHEITPLLFKLLNRVISLLFWLLTPLVVSILILLITLILVTANNSSRPENQTSVGNATTLAIQNQIAMLLPKLETMTDTIWRFAAPLLSFCIVVAILKWIFLSQGMDSLRAQLLQTTRDVPSIIAIMVLFTVCLLPLMGIEIPQAMSNIGLVIVGFYFGSKRSNQRSDSKE